MQPVFSVGESIKFGWHTLKAHSNVLLPATLIIFALQVASTMVNRVLGGTPEGIGASIVLFVADLFAGAGLTLMSLKLAREEAVALRDLFPKPMLVVRYYCAVILAALITIAPLVLGGFIAFGFGIAGVISSGFSLGEGSVPAFSNATPLMGGLAAAVVIALIALVCAVYFGLRYAVVRFVLLEGAGITESLGQSAMLMRGVKWRLLWFMVVLVLLNIVGAVLFLVGLLVTVPVSAVAFAHVYLKLKARG